MAGRQTGGCQKRGPALEDAAMARREAPPCFGNEAREVTHIAPLGALSPRLFAGGDSPAPPVCEGPGE
jgi:hypothetical protein